MPLHPLTEISHLLQDDTPSTKFMKQTLESDDLVVFTDSKFRDTYKMTKHAMEIMEVKWKAVILYDEEYKDLKPGIEQLLEKITNNAVPPHVFYKQKYYASGRIISRLYAHGELETLLGLDAVLVH
ncbi:uncharacterized protein LOC129005539 [Macrosteles quadrilineatus]|uniref:uncharacterized protein LOC129005539 n=1 Tax=Macrosteles quadrilineatus TaxID=74068 RepID=UPI0023E0ECEE|nr:uncharacterized protein LOC129005539 [Macrosteles quadrilineatus]